MEPLLRPHRLVTRGAGVAVRVVHLQLVDGDGRRLAHHELEVLRRGLQRARAYVDRIGVDRDDLLVDRSQVQLA